jgi:hypothetical protein
VTITLERSSTSTPPHAWSAAPQPIIDTVTEHTVAVPTAGVTTFYRLAHS